MSQKEEARKLSNPLQISCKPHGRGDAPAQLSDNLIAILENPSYLIGEVTFGQIARYGLLVNFYVLGYQGKPFFWE
jgi:hypothetical protein